VAEERQLWLGEGQRVKGKLVLRSVIGFWWYVQLHRRGAISRGQILGEGAQFLF
jgi:hypothetical protein